MKHKAENPFPKLCPSGKIIVDEVCTCGHLRSEHSDTIAFGHGNCGHCFCQKYTWKALLFQLPKGGVN